MNNLTGLDHITELLLNCLHQDFSRFPSHQLSVLTNQEWNNLVDLAIQHRIVPLLHHRLNRNKISKNIGNNQAYKKLQAYARQVSKNNLLYYGELRKILVHFNENKIDAIPLKGIYLAEKVYQNPGMREMNDMDVLFQTKDLNRVYFILSDMGYEPIKPIGSVKISYVIQASVHLPRMIKENVAGFEIHWNIAKPGQPYSIDPAELWHRSRPDIIAGKKTMALSPEDLLLHLCFHTSYGHMFSFGMRPFYDIAEVVRHYSECMNWDQVIECANCYHWSRGVFLAMMISKNFTGAAIPKQVIEQIKTKIYYPAILKTAKTQILTEKERSKKVSITIINFINAGSIFNKTKTVLHRIFLPKKQMYIKYPIRPGSLLLYAYYVYRFCQMLYLHSSRIIRISGGKTELSDIAERKQSLHHWMIGKE